ncbi:hypothetical protein LMG28138_04639 [Pararobbsia alpina]|uniref:Uncharacterized protein n=1 Tax=Pararobbsia alpina TaxID=621374 RepID=A0A6S7BH35_9BURK|nr:hypothetical protein LMG28138_04639 [Pararobbsia alpina]
MTGSTVDSTGTLAAGVDTHGKLTGAGDLNVMTSGALSATGQNTASGNLAFSGSRIAMNGAQTLAKGSASLTTLGALGDSGDSGDSGNLALTGARCRRTVG